MVAAFSIWISAKSEKSLCGVFSAVVCGIEERPSSLSDVAAVEPVVQAGVDFPACEDELIDLPVCF
jgi:hypothetical protein